MVSKLYLNKTVRIEYNDGQLGKPGFQENSFTSDQPGASLEHPILSRFPFSQYHPTCILVQIAEKARTFKKIINTLKHLTVIYQCH